MLLSFTIDANIERKVFLEGQYSFDNEYPPLRGSCIQPTLSGRDVAQGERIFPGVGPTAHDPAVFPRASSPRIDRAVDPVRGHSPVGGPSAAVALRRDRRPRAEAANPGEGGGRRVPQLSRANASRVVGSAQAAGNGRGEDAPDRCALARG